MINLEQKTKELIDTKINNSEIFTAYDLTTELRKKFNFNINHNQIRNYVRNFYNNGYMNNYTCELANFPNVKGDQPWIYYYIHEDNLKINNYKNNINNASNNNSNNVTSTLNNTNVSYILKTTDKRGTLLIPNSYVKDCEYHQYDTAYVYEDGKKILVKRNYIPNAINSYCVDRDYNIRITKNTLGKVFDLKNKSVFKISLDKDIIIIE